MYSGIVLAIDQGTTSTRAMLFTKDGEPIGVAQKEFTQHFPQSGWVEHDPKDIWQTTLDVCQEVIQNSKCSPDSISSIGITNQRETVLAWNKETGETLYPAIVWQDRRTAGRCQSLKTQGYETVIQEKTGLLLDPYFSASKIQWLFENVPEVSALATNGKLCVGTVDSFLLWHLTGGKSFKTDVTNASRTLLFNIHSLQWDDELLHLFGIPVDVLPEVQDCCADFGATDTALLGKSIPITAIAGDQHAAMIGQACIESGMAKSTYGTGCFLMINTGKKALTSQNKLLTTVAYKVGSELAYAMEGSIFMAGATIQWLRDQLGAIQSASDCEKIAESVGYDNPVMMVPAFTGLGAPYWDPHAQASILGLTRDSGMPQIVTAGLQSVCYQTADLVQAMTDDGIPLKELRVDGGMVGNRWLLQFLADVLCVTIKKPVMTETTVFGAALLSALHTANGQSLSTVRQHWNEQANYQPQLLQEDKDALLRRWRIAVKSTRAAKFSI